MRRHRSDDNQQGLVRDLEARGWYVKVVGDRLQEFDLLIAKGGRLVLCEVKDGSKPASQQRLTPAEEAFQAAMKAHGITVELLTCAEDIQVIERTITRDFYAAERNR